LARFAQVTASRGAACSANVISGERFGTPKRYGSAFSMVHS
jgi:hypothetical protein